MIMSGLPGPVRVLEHDTIAVEVFEGPTLAIPVWVVGGHAAKASGNYAIAGVLPVALVSDVEDQQMVLGWCDANLVPALRREFQMIGMPRMSENRTVETLMIRELGEDREAEAACVHVGNRRQVVRRASDAHDVITIHDESHSLRRPFVPLAS